MIFLQSKCFICKGVNLFRIPSLPPMPSMLLFCIFWVLCLICVCVCVCVCVCIRVCVCVCIQFNCKLLKASPYSAIEPNNSHRQSIDTKLTGIIVDNTLDCLFSSYTYFLLENSNDFFFGH